MNTTQKSAPPANEPVQVLPGPPTTDTTQPSPSPSLAPARFSDQAATLMPEQPSTDAGPGPPPTPINAPSLPSPTPMANPSFVWGEHDAETFMHSVTAAYAEVVHWRKNTFPVPYGNAGKKFVSELSTLYRAYAEGSALESIALKAVTVMSMLLLQKPSCNSKRRDHSACLERRLCT